jgi:hypothetical protein
MIRQSEPLWRIIAFVTALSHFPALPTGLCKVASAAPGTGLCSEVFTRSGFLNEAVGRSVMYARRQDAGTAGAFAHIGTYELDGDESPSRSNPRHNPIGELPLAMAGTDDATLLAAAGRATCTASRAR